MSSSGAARSGDPKTDLVLARLLGEAMRLAIEIRDGEVVVPNAAGPRLVDALNQCLEHVAHDDLVAAGLTYHNVMDYRELLAWLRVEPP